MSNVRARVVAAGILGVLCAMLLAACSSKSNSTPTAAATSNTPQETTAVPIDTTLNEWSVTNAPITVRAGEVKFVTKNAGAIVHEFVIVKTDLDPASLPTLTASDTLPEGHAVGDVDEEAVSSPGEIEDINPGATKDATFRLTPGKYVLICNLAGHYAQGMRVGFTVE